MNNANVTDSGAFSKYNALQLELRRRLSKGFSANVNYQYAFEGGSQFDGFSFGRAWTDIPVTGNPTVRHAIKFQADWMLPFGRGERFGGDMSPLVNALVGGWSVTGVGRLQTTVQDLGNVRLVGMTRGRPAEGVQVLPQGERVHRHRRDLDAARRHHPEHAARVQHEQRDARRLLDRASARRKDGTSRPPTRRPASRSGQATARRAACCCSRRGSSGSTSAWRSGSASAARGTSRSASTC